MKSWASQRLDELEKEELVAFLFKSKSPSSGMRSIKVYKEDGNVLSYSGQGLFANAFINRFHDIPVEDEGRLNDAGIRENFIETIFTLQRWRNLAKNADAGKLVDFHSRHKYALMAHSQTKMRELGRIVSRIGKEESFSCLLSGYRDVLGKTLAIRKTSRSVFNVLLHIIGYFKKTLSNAEKAELLAAAERYHRGVAPLIVPLTLINHYVLKYPQPYLEIQTFLNPHPIEMGLLNHV